MSRREFTPETIRACWQAVGGRCQCTRMSHGHGYRCNHILDFSNRGRDGLGAWEANHRDGNPSNNAPSNCEILCWTCHRATRNFGG